MAVPSFPLLQLTFTCADIVAVNNEGSVMVTLAMAVQLLLSVTVTEYVPADNPVVVVFVNDTVFIVLSPFVHK